MIRTRTLLQVMALSMMLCAYAAQWVMVASNADEQDYIDNESIKTEGDFVYYTKKTLIVGPNNGYRRIYGQRAHTTYVYAVENCKTNTSKILNIKLQDADGKDIMSAVTPSEVEFMPVIEASLGEKAHHFACRKQGEQKTKGRKKVKHRMLANYVPLR